MLRRAHFLSIPVLVLAMTAAALTADKSTTFLDPAKAGPDFAVQGEYVGKVPSGDGPVDFGVQVIALGDGKFQGVGYSGGLPGAGWDKSEKITGKGATVDGVPTAKVVDKNVTVTIKNGVLAIVNEKGDQIAALKKIERKSPTLGAKPPKGAIVLFDGKTADNFKGGRMTDDGLLMAGATSKQKFQSFTLHMEFQTPFKPAARGQGRGNSGFYAQGRYEIQILDSFGLEGRDNECGGIYSVGPPDVNMCLPPLSWQTYDVDFQTAQFKDGKKVKDAVLNVRHNGVLIHKDRVADHKTTAAPVNEGPEPGPIFLQNHGNPVRFRNIWVVEK